jgi:hypothetical protein
LNANAKPLVGLLRQRESNLHELCAAVPISYEHFSAVLNGRRKGKHTWKRLRNLLTEDERAAVVAAYGEVFR